MNHLTAKEAKEIALANQTKEIAIGLVNQTNQLESVLTSIRNNAEEGKTRLCIFNDLSKDVIISLRSLGFKLHPTSISQSNQGIFCTITW